MVHHDMPPKRVLHSTRAGNMLPGLLLKNEAVVALGALKPTEPGQLRNIQGIKPKTLQNHSRHILAAVQRGVETAQGERAQGGAGREAAGGRRARETAYAIR